MVGSSHAVRPNNRVRRTFIAFTESEELLARQLFDNARNAGAAVELKSLKELQEFLGSQELRTGDVQVFLFVDTPSLKGDLVVACLKLLVDLNIGTALASRVRLTPGALPDFARHIQAIQIDTSAKEATSRVSASALAHTRGGHVGGEVDAVRPPISRPLPVLVHPRVAARQRKPVTIVSPLRSPDGTVRTQSLALRKDRSPRYVFDRSADALERLSVWAQQESVLGAVRSTAGRIGYLVGLPTATAGAAYLLWKYGPPLPDWLKSLVPQKASQGLLFAPLVAFFNSPFSKRCAYMTANSRTIAAPGDEFTVRVVLSPVEKRLLRTERTLRDVPVPDVARERPLDLRKRDIVGMELKLPHTLFIYPEDREINERGQLWLGTELQFAFRVAIPDNFIPAGRMERIIQRTVNVHVNGTFRTPLVLDELKCVRNAVVEPDTFVGRGGQRDLRPIFISYAHEDIKTVKKVIRRSNWEVEKIFIDENIRQGSKWQPEIKKAIDECETFHLFWSRSAKKADWVRQEREYASDIFHDTGKPLLVGYWIDHFDWRLLSRIYPRLPSELTQLQFRKLGKAYDVDV